MVPAFTGAMSLSVKRNHTLSGNKEKGKDREQDLHDEPILANRACHPMLAAPIKPDGEALGAGDAACVLATSKLGNFYVSGQ